MTPRKAMDELLENGLFKDRGDGWCYAVKFPPKKKKFVTLNWYIELIHTLSVWSVATPTQEGPTRVTVTTGGDPFSLMWRVNW